MGCINRRFNIRVHRLCSACHSLGEEGSNLKNAKTIQIFLPDGNPRSIKIAGITSRAVQVVLIPRVSLDLALEREALSFPGLYMLFGSNENEGKPSAYIGEVENFAKRIKNPDHQKREWTHAVVAVSQNGLLTKTHVKFLESISIAAAKKANRYLLENAQSSTKPHVRETDEADILDFFETMQLLVSTLGYPIFDAIKKSESKDLLYCKGKKASATGEYSEDGLVVLKGSTCNRELVKSARGWVVSNRNTLLEQGVLVEEGDVLRFTEDFAFSSPSSAAIMVLGRPANGWIDWKYENGRTLDKVQRQVSGPSVQN